MPYDKMDMEIEEYKIWVCQICGFIYDEKEGWPDDGISAGTKWEDIDEEWVCPACGVGKEEFEMEEISEISNESIKLMNP